MYMPCIINRRDFKEYAVMIPLVESDEGMHICFEVRAEGIPQGGEICFPGGAIEPGEDECSAALRETKEELGVNIADTDYKGALLSVSGRLIHVFTGRAVNWDGRVHEPGEVANSFSIAIEWFKKTPVEKYAVEHIVSSRRQDSGEILLPADELGLPAVYNDKWKVYDTPVYLWRSPYGFIWGITAAIIYHIFC
ncbi:CoA pyrophosphatase [Spirochaetia bacterium 38H-sp]|uniref:CoA pyrophosphatase n=1 Tax=Rarispira pelagica TaxID=3141764 RepID=A0ABU9U8S6_9SPIR